jgi:diacylglycerol kinase family enzyme
MQVPGDDPRHFLAMAGAGLDAWVVRNVSPSFKRKFGKLSYWVSAFGMLGKKLVEFDVKVDGELFRSSFVLASRVKNYGGDLTIARHADLLGDDLAIVAFAGPGTMRYLLYFSGVLLNLLGSIKGVRVVNAQRLELTPVGMKDVDVQLDGEWVATAPCTIDVVPAGVRFLMPPKYLRR